MPSLPVVAEPKSQPTEAHYNVTCKSEKDWWDKTKPFVEIAGIFLLAAYTAYTIKIYRANRDAANAAKSAADTAAASLRPWIKIEKVELRKGAGPIHTLQFHWPSTGAVVPPNLQLTASLLNVGHSVAQDVEVAMELFFAKFEADKWHNVVTQEERRFCSSAAYHTEAGITDIVFPSDSWQWYGVAGGAVPKSVTRPAASLIMCVGYRGGPGTRYQTQARFGLYEDNSVFVTAGVDADIDSLRLIRDEYGDHAY